MRTFPSVFVSHGAPTIALERGPAHAFLRGLGKDLGRPDAILSISAHWETARPAVSTAVEPATIHDFYGFPEALYRLRYPAPGAPELGDRAAATLAAAGYGCEFDPERGLDHGAWTPLILMYPEADVPVAQLSIQHHLGPAHHLAVGRALSSLRHDGVLVLASGNLTHNLEHALQRLRSGEGADDPPPDWARAFDDWVAERAAGLMHELANYRDVAPFAHLAHPRDEHYLPLMVVAGAGGEGPTGSRLHASFAYASLSMAAFAFGEDCA